MDQERREKLIQQARETAEGYFRRGEYFCSEAVLTTINDMLGRPLPREIVRLASGFPIGIGKSGCLCGAISGGVMALGLVYGRTEPGTPMPKSFPTNAALHDYIKEKYGSTCCRVLVRPYPEFNSPERKEHCIRMTGEVAAWVMNRLFEDGAIE